MTSARVTGLYVYPVKSCRGVALKELSFNSQGPLHDRQWMLVDGNNEFLTLRTNSKLSEIKTALQGPFLHLYAGSNKILINMTEECSELAEVKVWNDTLQAGVENKSVNDALSDFLEKSVKLVRYQSQSFRDLKNAATASVKETRFTDARPVLVVNQATLDGLNAQLQERGSAHTVFERFRANVIIEGPNSRAEDNIRELKIGALSFGQPKLCGRCPVITQDVQTGKVVSKETLQILAADRSAGTGKVTFGVYVTPLNTGVIKLNDSVELIS